MEVRVKQVSLLQLPNAFEFFVPINLQVKLAVEWFAREQRMRRHQQQRAEG
jgi:hypothetical protein